jgi:Zn-dependent protease with chaperone function
MILLALGIAGNLRLAAAKTTGNWTERWRRSLFLFIFPPLLLLMTAIAVICMGYQGQMLGFPASKFSYLLAVVFVLIAIFSLLRLAYQIGKSLQKIALYPQQFIEGKLSRLLDTNFPYSAQIGFWQPQLVVSEGLLKTLDREHLQAVLAHEQAHLDCRDTFWFFWLGWLGSFTAWLPNTEVLWQELLLLREMRADRQAAQQIDSLLLAESLLFVAKTASQFQLSDNYSDSFSAPFNNTILANRLVERIDFLLMETESTANFPWWNWLLIALTLIPLVTVPLHY